MTAESFTGLDQGTRLDVAIPLGVDLGRVAVLVGIGVAAGAAAALWASQFVGSLLFGLQPHDPATLAGGAAILIAVGGVAGFLPARRAARIDPARVLRQG